MRHMLLLLAFAGSLLLAPAGASADTLPLPANLVSLDSPEGEVLLVEAEARSDYFPLSLQFVTQNNQAFCGVASTVMVLNALKMPAPASQVLAPFSAFDQENVFNPATEAVVARAVVERMGMTLDQLGGLLAAHGLKAEVHHAANSSVDDFRRLVSQELEQPGGFVVVNYLRGGNRPGERRPHLAARRLRCRQRPFPDPRRLPLQIPAGLGVRGRAVRCHEHDRFR